MRAALSTDRVVLVPNEPATVTIEVTNSLEVIDGITAALDLGEGLTVTSVPQILPMFPDGTGVLTLTLRASATFAAGIHRGAVDVRSTVEPDVVRLPLEVEVTPAPAAALTVLPTTRRGRTKGAYTVVCDNSGNTPIELSLAASDPARALVADFEPPLLTVDPGGSGSTEMAVFARRQWFGNENRRAVSILGTSNDLELEAQATFVQKPVVARGLRTALVLGAIVAVWALVFVFALDRALAKDPLTKQVPASFYAAKLQPKGASSSASSSSGLSANLVGDTSTGAATPPGAVPKSGVVIGVGGTMNGTVIARSTGAGIGRITVQAVRDSPGGPLLVASAASGADGSYSIPGLLPGLYRLRFTAEGYTDVWYPDATSFRSATPVSVDAMLQTSGVNAVITGNPGTLNGTVETGQTPAAPVTITVQPEQGGNKPIGPFQTDAQGNYSIPNLPAPGSYDLSFTSPGYQVGSDTEEIAGGATRVANTVTLSAARGTLGGTVTDGVNPLGAVTITATANGQTVTSATPTTGAVGQFTIPNLATPYTYLLTLVKTGYGTQTLAVSLGPGQSLTNLVIVMPGGAGQVSGTVTNPLGAALGNVTVTVNGVSGTASTQTLTAGAVGTYLLSGLSTPGAYTLTFSLTGYISQTLAVDLSSSGSATGVNVTLPFGSGTITGTVVDAKTGTPLSAVQISITDGTNVKTTQTTSTPPGGFSVTGLSPAAYSITFSLPNYENQTALVQLGPGGTPTVSISLQPDG